MYPGIRAGRSGCRTGHIPNVDSDISPDGTDLRSVGNEIKGSRLKEHVSPVGADCMVRPDRQVDPRRGRIPSVRLGGGDINYRRGRRTVQHTKASVAKVEVGQPVSVIRCKSGRNETHKPSVRTDGGIQASPGRRSWIATVALRDPRGPSE